MTRRLLLAMLMMMVGASVGAKAAACRPQVGFMDAGELIRKMRIALEAGRTKLAPENLRAGYGLEADPAAANNPHLAPVRLVAAPAVGLARARITRAARAVAERDALLRSVTAYPETAENLREAASLRQERRSAAMVWASLADRLLRHDPADR